MHSKLFSHIGSVVSTFTSIKGNQIGTCLLLGKRSYPRWHFCDIRVVALLSHLFSDSILTFYSFCPFLGYLVFHLPSSKSFPFGIQGLCWQTETPNHYVMHQLYVIPSNLPHCNPRVASSHLERRVVPVYSQIFQSVMCHGSRDRLVVRTLRCGRNNPGSNPGHGIGHLLKGKSADETFTSLVQECIEIAITFNSCWLWISAWTYFHIVESDTEIYMNL